jgi:protein-disulfide isomerase
MNNRFIIILAVIVVGFFGVLFFTKKDAGAPNGGSSSSDQLTNHTIGGGKTGVVLVEYGDFECPACYRFYPVIEQVKEKYKDQITFQFRHFPLVEIHQNALLAARASEAAAKQNKFWEMYNKLYTNQPQWSNLSDPTSAFESYAKELGLDVTVFMVDLKGEETNRIVQADRNSAKEQGYSSTPTFVLDGEVLTEPRDSVEYFSEKIDAAIAKEQQNGQ